MHRINLPRILALFVLAPLALPIATASAQDPVVVMQEAPVDLAGAPMSEEPCMECYHCGPRWYARAEALFLDRDNGSADRVLFEDAGLNPLFSTGDFNFDYEPGVRVLLGAACGPCGCCSAWEVEYFGIFDWNDSAVITDPANIFGVQDLSFVNGFFFADEVRIDYTSELHSVEANCVKCLCDGCCHRVELLCGARYLSLNENLTLASNNTVGEPVNAIYDIDVDNDLYGLQIGGRVTKQYCGWSGELVGKAGLYYSHADLGQVLLDNIPNPTPIPIPASAKGDDVAFVGELRVSVQKCLSHMWSVRAGYNLLWVEGVALAPDQVILFDLLNDPPATVNQSGGLFAHGASVGLEARW